MKILSEGVNILAIESSATIASVAIYSEDTLLAEYTSNLKKTHSQTLLPMINEIMNNLGLKARDLDYVAISEGPGSYTGLRIGAATAKGIALAAKALDGDKELKGIPIVPVSSLEALAFNVAEASTDLICPIMDARRDRFYCGLYDFVDGQLEAILSQRVLTAEELINFINENNRGVAFVGDGVSLIKNYAESIKVSYKILPPHLHTARAASIAYAALRKIKEGNISSSDDFSPNYLVASQAERESFREIKIEDANELARIEAACINPPWTKEAFEKSAMDENSCFVICEGAGRIKGYIGLVLAGDQADITNVAVDPDFRRIGVAKALINYIKNKLVAKGIKEIFLEVRASNIPAIELYKNTGFIEVGIRKDFYSQPKEDAILMKVDI